MLITRILLEYRIYIIFYYFKVQESRGLYYLILILTFTSVSTFVGMAILFYHTFFR